MKLTHTLVLTNVIQKLHELKKFKLHFIKKSES